MATLNRWRRGAGSERGAELVELALVLPVLMLVVMGIADFGLLFQKYQVLTNAAREATRVGTLAGATSTDVETRVTDYLTANGLTDTATTDVDPVLIPRSSGGNFRAIRVTVTYPHSFIFLNPIAGYFGDSFADKTLTAVSTMRTEVQFGS
jgi:Flp pilus assembly protein TadG